MGWRGFLTLKTNDLWKIYTNESQTIWKDIRQFIASNSSQHHKEERKGKRSPTRGGKPIAKPRSFYSFFFKGSPHSGDQKPRLQQMPQQNLSAASLAFLTRLPLFSLPQLSTTSRSRISGSWGRGPRGKPCPAPPRAMPLLTRADPHERRQRPRAGCEPGSARAGGLRPPRTRTCGWDLRSPSRCL